MDLSYTVKIFDFFGAEFNVKSVWDTTEEPLIAGQLILKKTFHEFRLKPLRAAKSQPEILM